MSQYVDATLLRSALAVGVISTVVVPARSMKGNERIIVELYNSALVDTFNGTIEVSPNGLDPWVVLPDDTFTALGPLTGRYAFVDASYQYMRVVGAYGVGTESLLRTVSAQRVLP